MILFKSNVLVVLGVQSNFSSYYYYHRNYDYHHNIRSEFMSRMILKFSFCPSHSVGLVQDTSRDGLMFLYLTVYNLELTNLPTYKPAKKLTEADSPLV
jgi:hypothetical protein